ncbi:LacI family DNA-binding transcriptional regulator [Halalkalibacter akibai]|uniref:Transcriptional regulator n=1 Tax=Halalkalibacter akibai (strain ATCC 43226 / DSM 21942 / CIP 109018 / JCM 9157 / 1139) TaxID=1236973 RepID=W4QWZ1_HALA3|nr:LacI family DNA-binding transcriptional regulator [Halalkalibacter akibai]GAE36168.1 transcriptional regulator [Halalkalibacter akibai JCM 9157]
MVRIIDVAKRANVSTATVSRVLSSPHTVREETMGRVLEAIKDLDYHPNILARQLRTLETKTVIVVVPDISNPFFSKVLRGIEYVAAANGYQVLLKDTTNDLELESGYVDLLRQKKADGMIFLTVMNSELVNIVENQYPVVLACEYIEGSNIPTVSIDNISAARKATEYLIQLGHRQIACISGPTASVLGQDRLKGYYQALSQYNVTVDPVLIQEGDFTYESGFNVMNKLLALNQLPTGVFAANDEMALGAIKAIKSKHFRVPADISVIGFDNIKFSTIVEPELTTIAQPAFEIGNKAMDLLIKLMKNKKIIRSQFILDDKLIIRNSCVKRSDKM